jgi:hypothetical protein
LKAFCLAFAFLLASLPANAEELPQTSNAWRATQPDQAEPGQYQWTVVDNEAGGASAPAAQDQEALRKSAPARAALAQIRAETDRIMKVARETSTKVSRIRYDLRVRCLIEQVEAGAETVSVAGMQHTLAKGEGPPTDGTLELCEVDYSQKVRSQPEATAKAPSEMIDYKVAFPVE